ncbi:MAG TPA: hypothetical protein VLB73_04810 [Patescibacteria group bacterium]|nr:hypothetical protein [Patescibacteria group bacterium]
MKLSSQQIKSFQKEILGWFEKNKRDLPWRHSRDPYNILISEVMLQQTQVSRVIPKFKAWMDKFPTLESLAGASTRDVLLYWSGLGYNRRALYLKRLARELVENSVSLRGEKRRSNLIQDRHALLAMTKKIAWPMTEKELRKLPGIGEYTARALLCFGFNHQIAVVDTNVRKVILVRFKDVILSRAKDIDSSPSGSSDQIGVQNDKIIQQVADQLLPKGKAYEWNQALMDYASAVLKHEKISIPKQSSFKTSKRFYRGQVIRLLLQKDIQTADALFAQLDNNGITKDTFTEILTTMVKDGLIDENRNVFSLKQ